MVHAQAFDPRLHRGIQRVPGRAHVGELGVGVLLRDHPRMQHRVTPGRILERGIRVPQPVAERIFPAAVVGGEDLAVRADVRDVGQRFVAEAVLRDDARPGFRVKLAIQPLGERDLLVVRECLVMEDEHRMLVHRRADRGERSVIECFAQRDRTRFAEEGGVQAAKRDRHRAQAP